jgi:hypothetical protein
VCLQAQDAAEEIENGETAQASLLGRGGGRRSFLGLELTMMFGNLAASTLELLGFHWIAIAHEENHKEQAEEREESTSKKHCCWKKDIFFVVVLQQKKDGAIFDDLTKLVRGM